jgi:hypothetical protein
MGSWNLYNAAYFICTQCSVVDRDRSRMSAGYPCPICGCTTAAPGRMYFHVNIMVLIDLLEESYDSLKDLEVEENVAAGPVAIVLFFCTLKEALLEHFLRQMFATLKTSDGIRHRLIKDHRLFHEKIQKLLPALVGDKWSEAVVQASQTGKRDFSAVNAVMVEAAEQRNRFLHDASVWDISKELANRCIDSLDDLLRLFVALHNHYAHGAWKAANYK